MPSQYWPAANAGCCELLVQSEKEGRVNVTVYGLKASDIGGIRYVGQTKKSLSWRLKYHLVDAKRFPNRRISKWINSVAKRGASIVTFVLAENAIENQAEIKLIEWYKRSGIKLVNGTNGGEGVAGHIPSHEVRKKLSILQRARRLSNETKAKISAAHTGMIRPEGTGEKIAATKRGKKCPWVTERNNDPAFREKARLARIARWSIIPKKKQSIESRLKISIGVKKWWKERSFNVVS